VRFDRIPRYVLVGLLCAGLYNVIMIAGDALGVNYLVSTCVAFVVNVLVGYTLHCRFTFSERMTWPGLARYTAAMLLNLPLSAVGIWLLHGVVRLPMLVASPLVTAFLFGWNYVATHWAVVTRALTRKKGAPGGLAR
jgi:putative flippase GtrA